MRRIVCLDFAPLDHLEIEEGPDLLPADHQVVVAVKAAGVNYVDALIVQGRYQLKPGVPFSPGSEVAGEVTAVGDDVEDVAVGDRVMVAVGLGGYAEQVAVPATSVIKLDASMSYARAAAMLQSYSTAVFALTRRTTAVSGEVVLVLGAGGGVGQATVDVASAMGLRVIAAASTSDKLTAAKAAGAEDVVNYEEGDLKDRVMEISDSGVDIVVDPVGGALADPALRTLTVGGRYLVIGFASGEIPRLRANQILLNNRTVVGVDWGGWAMHHPDDNQVLTDELMTAVASGGLNPPEPTSYPLDRAAEALADLEGRRVTGKIVLVP